MVTASKVIIRDLCVLDRFIRRFKVSEETRWFPSAENVHVDRLSKQWYVRVPREVFNLVKDSDRL